MTTRHVTDYRVLAALAHPLRRRLLDVLRVDGPSTASMLAERTDQAVGNISHHMKVLAANDLVEPAPELARDRRERWWRSVSMSVRWSTTDFASDPAAEAAAQAAGALGLQRQLELTRTWLEHDAAMDPAWREAAFNTDAWLRLSSDELAELGAEIVAVVDRWRSRADSDQSTTDRQPVFFLARGFPGQP